MAHHLNLSFKEETLVINDFEFSGTILSKVEESDETALLLFVNDNHKTFLSDENPLDNVII